MDNQEGQSRETGNIWYRSQGQTKQKHNTICVGHHYAQTNTNSVSRSWKQLEERTNRTLLLCEYRNGHHNTELRTQRHIIEQHKQLKLLFLTSFN